MDEHQDLMKVITQPGYFYSIKNPSRMLIVAAIHVDPFLISRYQDDIELIRIAISSNLMTISSIKSPSLEIQEYWMSEVEKQMRNTKFQAYFYHQNKDPFTKLVEAILPMELHSRILMKLKLHIISKSNDYIKVDNLIYNIEKHPNYKERALVLVETLDIIKKLGSEGK